MTPKARVRARGGRPGLPIGTRREWTNHGGRYRVLTDHGWRLEHQVVMEQLIGRALRPGEEVRHSNGDQGDNRPENLELWVSLRLDLEAAATFDASTDAPTTVDGSPSFWPLPKTPSYEVTSLADAPPGLKAAYDLYRRLYVSDWRAKRKAAR